MAPDGSVNTDDGGEVLELCKCPAVAESDALGSE